MKPDFEQYITKTKLIEKTDASKKIFGEVFDDKTINLLHYLSQKKYFKEIEFAINEGKEAIVFRALDYNDEFKAVKIYRIKTANFHNMRPYIDGDNRFKKLGKDKHDMVFNWCKKEFKNLELAKKANVPVPGPLASKNNILVMDFIGDKEGIACKTLKDTKLNKEEMESVFEKVVDDYARLVFNANLIHADLSEFNILIKWQNEKPEPIIIDIGQAVLINHPKAMIFFERDIKNIARYFSRKGVEIDDESLKEKLRQMKEKIKKEK